MKKKTALVFGGGGFIGSHMIKRLKSEGYYVKGVDLKYPEFSDSLADEFMIYDLTNPEFFNDILTFNDLSEVINYAYSYIKNNQAETLLFSPSCSSFDQFRDYAQRGDIFKKLIHEKLNTKLLTH